LEHHLNSAAHAAHVTIAERAKIDTVEENLAGGRALQHQNCQAGR